MESDGDGSAFSDGSSEASGAAAAALAARALIDADKAKATQTLGHKRRSNPFIEYEDREKRLQNERRWLQEDAAYMNDRTQELKHHTVQKKLDFVSRDPEWMFDNTMLFNEFSHSLRTMTQLKEQLNQMRDGEGVLKELAAARVQQLKAIRQQQKPPDPAADPTELRRAAKQKERAAVASVKKLQDLQQSLHKSAAWALNHNQRRTSDSGGNLRERAVC